MQELNPKEGCKSCELLLKSRKVGELGFVYVDVRSHYTIDELIGKLKKVRLCGDLPVQFFDGKKLEEMKTGYDLDGGALNFTHR